MFSKILGEFHVGDYFPWLRWTARLGFNRRLRAARSALDRFTDKIIDDHLRRGKNPADADASRASPGSALWQRAGGKAGRGCWRGRLGFRPAARESGPGERRGEMMSTE